MDEKFDLDIIDELDYMMAAFPLSRRTQTTDNGKTKTANDTGNHLNDDKACWAAGWSTHRGQSGVGVDGRTVNRRQSGVRHCQLRKTRSTKVHQYINWIWKNQELKLPYFVGSINHTRKSRKYFSLQNTCDEYYLFTLILPHIIIFVSRKPNFILHK